MVGGYHIVEDTQPITLLGQATGAIAVGPLQTSKETLHNPFLKKDHFYGKNSVVSQYDGSYCQKQREKAGKTAQTCSYRLVAVCTENCSRSNVGLDYVG
jgi:hypothetical protein